MTGIVVKDGTGKYYNGIGKSATSWVKQLNKAKIYTSPKMAQNVIDHPSNLNKQLRLVAVEIMELGEYHICC